MGKADADVSWSIELSAEHGICSIPLHLDVVVDIVSVLRCFSVIFVFSDQQADRYKLHLLDVLQAKIVCVLFG